MLQYVLCVFARVCVRSHVAQEVHHRIWLTHSHELDLVAQQDLHGDEHEDFTRAADHLVPNSVDTNDQRKAGIKHRHARKAQEILLSCL